MRKPAYRLVTLILFAAIVGIGVIAWPQAGDEKSTATEEVEVKSYATMDVLSAFRLSQEGRVAAVRFKGSFSDLLRPVPRALERFSVGRTTIEPILAFQTEGEMVGLVTRRDFPLLRRAVNLVRGQQIIVEGTVIPERAGYKLMIVDDIKFEYDDPRDIGWRVRVFWPGETPKLITQPGTYTLELPVPDDPKKQVKFKIEVVAVREYPTKEEPKK